MNTLTVKDADQPTAFEMRPRTMEEAMKFCEIMANSDLVPNGYKGKPGNVLVAIQMGHELGMTPLRALRSIAIINGRASMWGDDVLAMVLASPVCDYVRETDSSDKEGVCKVRRKGGEEHVSRFTLDDAKRAGLLGKQGPWQTATARMLKLRARGFALRDVFADVLAGLVTAEEALDIPAPVDPAALPEPPKALKDRLRDQVAQVDATPTVPAPPLARPAESLATSPERPLPVLADGQPTSGAEDEPPTAPYLASLKKLQREGAATMSAVNAWYKSVPDPLKQDLYQAYDEALLSLKKK